MRVWPWLVVALLALYVWAAYYRAPPRVSVLQTSLEAFAVDALLQKQPLVIQDRVADLRELRRAWFALNPVKHATAAAGAWSRVRSKWCLMQPTEDAEILLCPPRCAMVQEAGAYVPHAEAHLIALPLAAGQVVVVPRRYHTHVESEKVTVMLVDDWVSWALP